MRVLTAILVGALFLDWTYTKIELHQLRRDNDEYQLLLSRHEITRRAQDEALLSCRFMIDDLFMSPGAATVLVTRSPYETRHGVLQEAGRRLGRLRSEQQEARVAVNRFSRPN